MKFSQSKLPVHIETENIIAAKKTRFRTDEKWKLKLTLLFVSSLTIMSVITISPALPQMATTFSDVKNSALLVKLVLTIPALMIALFSPITGRLIDRYGRLRILWFALVLYAVGGSAGFYLNNLYQILISRAVLGMSVGMSMTIVVTLIADYFEGIERQKFAGLQIAFMSLGGIVFLTLGGILSDYGWKYPFLIYLFSLVVLPFTILFLKEPAIASTTVEINPRVRAPKMIWMLFINVMIMWIVFFLIPVQIPFHLKSIGVQKNSLIGVAIATSTLLSAISSFFYSSIKGKLSFLAVFSFGYLLMSAGFFCISFSDSYLLDVIAMMLAGFGMGMMIPNTNIWVMKITPPQIRGKEIGKLATFWFLGQFLSPIVVFPVLSTLSLSSAFMLGSGFLLFLSIGFLVLHLSRGENFAVS